MFNKKLLMVLSMTAVSSTLLTGCFSNEREDLLTQAKMEHASGELEKAKKDFEKAIGIQSFSNKESEYDSVYKDTLNQLWSGYYKEGDELVESKNFEKALESYKKASAISDESEDLQNVISQTKALLAEQKQLDEYVNFINPIISSSNELLRTFNKEVDAMVVGSITAKDFKTSVRTIVPKSNEVVAKVDDSLSVVNGGIADIHQILLALIEYQHRTFTMALEGAPMADLSERYIEVKQQQTELVQAIQEYANDKGIAFRPLQNNTDNQDTSAEVNSEDTAVDTSKLKK
ncbi:hypothetical protein U8V72_18340 [Priestia filamentosa]|uniref:hypothetical protein n=1 Tax=Priestia filamentosa TaxID=1402861 RepID=UPI00397AA6DE